MGTRAPGNAESRRWVRGRERRGDRDRASGGGAMEGSWRETETTPRAEREASPAGARGERGGAERGTRRGARGVRVGEAGGPDPASPASARARPRRRGTHPRCGSRCSPWRSPTRGAPGAAPPPQPLCSAAAVSARLRSPAPLHPSPRPPPPGSPSPALPCSRPGRGWPGDWLRPAPPPRPGSAAALPALPRGPGCLRASRRPLRLLCPKTHVGLLAGAGGAPRERPPRFSGAGPTLRFWRIDFQGLLRE